MDTTTRSGFEPCRSCSARVPVGAPWCSQCFTVVDTGLAVGDSVTRTAERDDDATPPEPSGARTVVTADDAQVLADRMLAELAVHERRARRWSGVLPERPGGLVRGAVALLGVVAVSVVGFGAMALAGALL